MTPAEEYMRKRREFQEAELAMNELVDKLGAIYQALRSWHNVIVSPGSYTSEAMSVCRTTIPANDWLTAQQVSAALSKYWQAKFDYEQTWQRLPADQKKDYQDMKPTS